MKREGSSSFPVDLILAYIKSTGKDRGGEDVWRQGQRCPCRDFMDGNLLLHRRHVSSDKNKSAKHRSPIYRLSRTTGLCHIALTPLECPDFSGLGYRRLKPHKLVPMPGVHSSGPGSHSPGILFFH